MKEKKKNEYSLKEKKEFLKGNNLVIPNCGISIHSSSKWINSTGIPSFSRPYFFVRYKIADVKQVGLYFKVEKKKKKNYLKVRLIYEGIYNQVNFCYLLFVQHQEVNSLHPSTFLNNQVIQLPQLE